MSMAKIMVLGGTGMLGHKMFQVLRECFAATFCTVRGDTHKPPFDRVKLLQGDDVIRGVDVTAFPTLDAILLAFRPEWVINCVGVTKQRAEGASPIPSITINSLLTPQARQSGSPLERTHYSFQHRLRIQRQAWKLPRKGSLRCR